MNSAFDVISLKNRTWFCSCCFCSRKNEPSAGTRI